jgi:hypothetical protein
VSTKMAVFWVVAPCSLVEVYQRFRGSCCLLRFEVCQPKFTVNFSFLTSPVHLSLLHKTVRRCKAQNKQTEN